MIYDINGNPLQEADLSRGYVSKHIRIKPDATPVDDIVKFAYYDDDYETIDVYVEYTQREILERQLAEKRAELSEYDDVLDEAMLSIMIPSSTLDEGAGNDVDNSYLAEGLARRIELRAEIAQLEREIGDMENGY